jgi:poly(3-hydroxybutyrate) depolymerase
MRLVLCLVWSLSSLSACQGAEPSVTGEPPPDITAATHATDAYPAVDHAPGTLAENPGNLDWYYHVPANLSADEARPLVVALHGCSQNATTYKNESGWSQLADQFRFYVVYPQQRSGNNGMTCFNWGGDPNPSSNQSNMDPAGLLRRGVLYTWKDHGTKINLGDESASIVGMVEKMRQGYNVSEAFVTGLSAGAYMSAVLLAVYPDVFSAGAIMAGGAYLCGATPTTTPAGQPSFYLRATDNYSCMSTGGTRTAEQWRDLVLHYTNYDKPALVAWPRVQLWHGASDSTVAPVNSEHLVEQWTLVHNLGGQAPEVTDGSGVHRSAYRDPQSGEVLVEKILVAGMDHAIAVDPNGAGPDGIKCGTAGGFSRDQHICSSYHAARFFGLVGGPGGGADGGVPADGGTGATDGGVRADGGVTPRPDGSAPRTGDSGAAAATGDELVSFGCRTGRTAGRGPASGLLGLLVVGLGARRGTRAGQRAPRPARHWARRAKLAPAVRVRRSPPASTTPRSPGSRITQRSRPLAVPLTAAASVPAPSRVQRSARLRVPPSMTSWRVRPDSKARSPIVTSCVSVSVTRGSGSVETVTSPVARSAGGQK